jgi:ribosomal protein S18 acetylase RimI-like enzyme
MKIRKSNKADLSEIMSIISDAQRYLASLKIDQWQDGYPNEAQILLDIANNDSYVINNDANEIMGTSVCTTKHEYTYDQIEGKWLTSPDSIYGVIHRIAVSDKFRKHGLAKFVFNQYENELKKQQINSLRVDTHSENLGMQKLLKSMNYIYCGIIILNSGAERLAFEKIL